MSKILRTLPLLLVLVGGATSVRAALVPYDLEKLSRKSRFVICGKVTRLNSYWGKLGNLGPVILTDATIRIQETWKGKKRKGQEITVQLLGGQIGELRQWCPESPTFQVGEEVLLFARPWNGRLWTSGWIQGKFRLSRRATGSGAREGAREMVVEGRRDLPIRRLEKLSAVKSRVQAYVNLSGKTSQGPPRKAGSRRESLGGGER